MITPDAIRRLADLGLSLFYLCGPQCSTHSHPPDKRGKVPLYRGWCDEPYRSADEIVPGFVDGYNLAIRTGPVDGTTNHVAVIDTDSPEQEAFIERHAPATPWTVRNSRGKHRYYRYPPGTYVKSAPREVDGVKVCDVKGVGGYVVAPGSVHWTGAPYEMIRQWCASDIASLPLFPLDLLPSDGRGAIPDNSDFPPVLTLTDFRAGYVLAERWLRIITDPHYHDRERYICRPGAGAHAVLFTVALTVRRGHPLCTAARYREAFLGGYDSMYFDADDADDAAVDLLERWYNNRNCRGPEGGSYPWPRRDLEHKVRSAGRAFTVPMGPFNTHVKKWNDAAARGEAGIRLLRAGAPMHAVRSLPRV